MADKTHKSEKTPVFRFLAFMLIPTMEILAKYTVIDGEYLPKSGAVVVAPNHYSEIDPIVIGRVMYKLGRVPRFLAKASIFSVPFVGWVLRKSGQIPVERSQLTRSSDPLAAAEQLVDGGLAVIIYPEGSLTRDPDYWPMRGKTGAVRIALEAGVPIIPVAHWGTHEVMGRYKRRISVFPRKKISVKFGPPVDLSAFAGKTLDSVALTEATRLTMKAITELMADLRGETPPAVPWDPAEHGQTEIGRF